MEMKTFHIDDSPVESYHKPNPNEHTVGNLTQRRFYNPEFRLRERKFFIDFSYVIYFTGLSRWDCNNYSDYITKIQLGYHLNRKTGEVVKGHIWIKDPETGKRAAPEVYAEFKKWLEKNHNLVLVIEREDDYDEDVIYDYPDLTIFEWSEEK